MPRNRPQWHQFSLKSFMLLVLVLAVAFALFYERVGRARVAAAQLKQAGASLQLEGPVGQTGSLLFPNRVISVAISREVYTPSLIAAMSKLPVLGAITLSHCDVTDDDLAGLTQCPALVTLYLADTPVSDAGLRHLELIPTLQVVDLSNTNVTPAGVERLKEALPRARVIKADRPTLTALQREAIAQIERAGGKVHHASYANIGLTDTIGPVHRVELPFWNDQFLEWASQFPTIGYISIDADNRDQVTDEGLRFIGRIEQLAGLTIRSGAVSDVGLNHLANLRNLERLWLACPRITGIDVKPFAVTTTLQSLTLECMNLQRVDFLDVSQMTRLRSVHLQCPKLDREQLVAMLRAENLTELGLERMTISGMPWEEIDTAPKVRELFLQGCELDEAAWRHLATWPRLRQLYLDATVLPVDAKVFKTFAPLRSLHFHQVELTPDHIRCIAQLAELRSIALVDCDLSWLTPEDLASWNVKMGMLHLQGTKVPDDVVEQLRRQLPQVDIHVSQN